MNKCKSCKYEHDSAIDEPCVSCSESTNHFEPKEHYGCVGCKYEDLEVYKEPCNSCKYCEKDSNLDLYVPKEEADEKDMVNHPQHYNRDGAIECIDEMITVFGKDIVACFCLCNTWKYRYRASEKGHKEDLAKSDYYMSKYKELVTERSVLGFESTMTVDELKDAIKELINKL